MDPLFNIYILNLLITLAMFIILVFRAWRELKNYRLMWKEIEWRRTHEVVGKVLRAEKDLFMGIDGGKELYDILCEMFRTTENQ